MRTKTLIKKKVWHCHLNIITPKIKSFALFTQIRLRLKCIFVVTVDRGVISDKHDI